MPAPKLNWETIEEGDKWYYRRCAVPGGWLVEGREISAPWDNGKFSKTAPIPSMSLVFIPDPKHRWGKEK